MTEYELKLKKIPSKLYTQKGKEIGESRIDYMEHFFLRLNKELDGEY